MIDKVICVNEDNYYSLTLNKEYKVLDIFDGRISIVNDEGQQFEYNENLFVPIQKISRNTTKTTNSNELCNKVCGKKYKVLYKTIIGDEKITIGILDNFAPSANIVLNGDTFNIIKYSNVIQMEEIIEKGM